MRHLTIAALLLASGACATRPTAPSPDPAIVADRLFFGRAIPGGGAVSDSEWSAFLEEIVTPAFPGGLTVWRADGQWLDEQGRIVREPVMVVEVIHEADPATEAAIVRVADEYRRRFRQEAVLRVTEDARMRLFDGGEEEP